MGEKHGIPYTTKSWNPITGCSYGCEWCWARRMAARQAGRNGYPANEPFRPTFHADKLTEPLKWRKPQRIACCFMGDLFDSGVPLDWIDQVFAMMALCSKHAFLVLTKQARRMIDVLAVLEHKRGNIHVGVSITNQADADSRLPYLCELSAAGWKTWVSYEPAIGPVEFPLGDEIEEMERAEVGEHGCGMGMNGGSIDWLVIGGASGPGAPPCNVEWIRSAVRQGQAAGVPVYVKQLGSDVRGKWEEFAELSMVSPSGKDPAEWPEDLRVQEVCE